MATLARLLADRFRTSLAKPQTRFEKSLNQAQMETAVREGTHPLRMDERIAADLFGPIVAERSVIARTLDPLTFRVNGVNLNKIAAGRDGWKQEQIFAGEHFNHREKAPVYTEVEVAPGKFEPVLVDGNIVLRSTDGDVVIVATSPLPMGNHAFAVMSKAGGREKLLKSLDGMGGAENFYKSQKITATGQFLKLSSIDDSDLILPPGMLEELRRNVSDRIQRSAQYLEYGLPTKRGLILAGHPGVGKTMALKLIAKQLPVTFILANTTMLPYAENVASLYDFARSVSPAIVALEDAETICKSNWEGRDPRLVELLNQLDGVVENSGVTTVLTTNYPAQLDRAIKDRPGRFDVRMDVPLPGKNEISKILLRNMSRTQKTKFVGTSDALDVIAQALANAGISGAYAAEAVTFASILSLEHSRGKDGVLEIGSEELGEAARRIIEYKKQMAEEK